MSVRDRTIRVFVSSTFRDMQAERDELVLKVFPQLRRLCEERGVTWGEIDLRWGITEEQSQRGEVLPICLEEIRRCRPYFIGLLGERYGWIPTAISDEVLEREPWIQRYSDGADAHNKSVTELEILHGVLNNPEMCDHSFFYFRDPAFIERLSPDQKLEDFVSENDQSFQKLNRLKEDIRQQHRTGKLKYEPRENYADVKSLGEQVLADFTALIDSLYPRGQEPTPLERERMDHEAFARSRAAVYIGRQAYFDRLDAHIASEDGPLVVLGESGSGKSALLANWALRYRERHPDHFLLLHFIGASPDSANASGLLRRIMLELKERFDLPDDVPAQADKTREEFPNWLTKVATNGPIVLVLDALNQLEDVDAAPDLGWLPRVFPKNCRVIVSTLPGRSLIAIDQRGWLQSTPALLVHPLDEFERRRLLHEYLTQYSRDLGSVRTDLVAHAPQTANPLYLRVLLNELRVFGQHEKLSERIDWYLEAQDPHVLYRKVISRWEEAYSDGTNLVRDTLSLIWAARHGLSESELLEALGQPGRPLPRAIWSPLFLAMADALVTRSGLLTFAHEFLREAIRRELLCTESDQLAAHQRLATFFQRESTWTERRLDELPWQLQEANECQLLHDTMTNHECFLNLLKRNAYDLIGYWLRLEPQFDIADSYTNAFARWEGEVPDDAVLSIAANNLALFLQDQGACYAAAEPLLRRSLALDEKYCGGHHPVVANSLHNLAAFLLATSRLEEAEPLMRRALEIAEGSLDPEHPDLSMILNGLAQILQAMNRLAEAEPLMRRTLELCELAFGPEHHKVATPLNNLAVLLCSTDRFAEAELLLRRSIAVGEQSYGPNHPQVSQSLSNLASLLLRMNRYPEAEALIHRGIAISETTLGSNHPDVARDLNKLGELLAVTNRPAEAESVLQRALTIYERTFGPQHPSVAESVNKVGRVIRDLNRPGEAESMFRRAISILEESIGNEHPDVGDCLNELAMVLHATNQLTEAETLMRRALEIAVRSYGEHSTAVATCVNNLAALLQAVNKLDEAESMLRRALVIEERVYGADHSSVATSLNNLANVLTEMHRLDEAETLLRRALEIDEHIFGSKHPTVAKDLSNLAMLLRESERLAEAEPLMCRALEICEHSFDSNHPNVALCLNNLAQLLFAMQRLDEAEPLMKRALEIDEKSLGAVHPDVARDLNNLALLFHATDRIPEAESLMARVLTIYERSYGDSHPTVAYALGNLAWLLKGMNKHADAEPLMRRALAMSEHSIGPDHPKTAIVLNNLAELLQDLKQFDEAELLMLRALSIDEQAFGASHSRIAPRLNNLAMLLLARNRPGEAERLIRRALDVCERCFEHSSSTARTLRANHTEILAALKQSEQRHSAGGTQGSGNSLRGLPRWCCVAIAGAVAVMLRNNLDGVVTQLLKPQQEAIDDICQFVIRACELGCVPEGVAKHSLSHVNEAVQRERTNAVFDFRDEDVRRWSHMERFVSCLELSLELCFVGPKRLYPTLDRFVKAAVTIAPAIRKRIDHAGRLLAVQSEAEQWNHSTPVAIVQVQSLLLESDVDEPS